MPVGLSHFGLDAARLEKALLDVAPNDVIYRCYPSPEHLSEMSFSDYSQRMAQNQVDLVRRFNRVVTQRVGALDDAYFSRGRSLGTLAGVVAPAVGN